MRWQELFKTDPARVCNYLPNLLPLYKPGPNVIFFPKILTLSARTKLDAKRARNARYLITRLCGRGAVTKKMLNIFQTNIRCVALLH